MAESQQQVDEEKFLLMEDQCETVWQMTVLLRREEERSRHVRKGNRKSARKRSVKATDGDGKEGASG